MIEDVIIAIIAVNIAMMVILRCKTARKIADLRRENAALRVKIELYETADRLSGSSTADNNDMFLPRQVRSSRSAFCIQYI